MPPPRSPYLVNIRSAFTLAEVLITLGTIGLVAAITLPNLIADYRDKIYLTQAKKAYSTLLNAMNLAKAELGISDYVGIFDPTTSSEVTAEKIFKQMNIIKYCGKQRGCWATEGIKSQDKDDNIINNMDTSGNFIRAMLADGSSIGIFQYITGQSDCLTGFPTDDPNDEDGVVYDYQCGQIIIDVNGKKRPNQYGADTFAFVVKPNSLVQYKGSLYDALAGDTLDYDKH